MRLAQQRLAVAIGVLYLSVGAILQAGTQGTTPKPEQLGQVNFSVSCTGEAQAQIPPRHGAVSLLRLEEGKAAFDEIASLDPALRHGVLGPGDDRGR